MEQKELGEKSGGVLGIVTGILLVFSGALLVELAKSPAYFTGALVAILLALFLSKKTAKHFHHSHTHTGDSGLDVLAPVILFFANILHPAVDGFSFHQTWATLGSTAGLVLGVSILIHEIFRQSALVSVFRMHGTKWFWVVGTALLGLLAGIYISKIGSQFLEKYESAIEIATLFAYSFIIGESLYAKHTSIKKGWGMILIGALIGLALVLFFRTH